MSEELSSWIFPIKMNEMAAFSTTYNGSIAPLVVGMGYRSHPPTLQDETQIRENMCTTIISLLTEVNHSGVCY